MGSPRVLQELASIPGLYLGSVPLKPTSSPVMARLGAWPYLQEHPPHLGDKDTQESAEDSQFSHEYGHLLDSQPEPSLANSRACTQRYTPKPDNHTDPILTTVPPRGTSPPAERCGQVSVGTEGTPHLLPAGKVQVGEAAEGEDRGQGSPSQERCEQVSHVRKQDKQVGLMSNHMVPCPDWALKKPESGAVNTSQLGPKQTSVSTSDRAHCNL